MLCLDPKLLVQVNKGSFPRFYVIVIPLLLMIQGYSRIIYHRYTLCWDHCFVLQGVVDGAVVALEH